jgi:ABC-2 type transport system permease protein
MKTNLFFSLVRHELRLFLSDKKALITSILVPIGIAAFFGMILGGSGSKPKSAMTLLVADNDKSVLSQKVITALQTETMLKIVSTTEVIARERVRKGEVSVAVILPVGLGKAGSSGFFGPPSTDPKPVVSLLFDPVKNVEVEMVRGLLTQHVLQTTAQSAFASDNVATNTKTQLDALKTNTTMAPKEKQNLTDLLSSVQKVYGEGGTSSAANNTASPATNSGFSMEPPCEIKTEAMGSAQDSEKKGTATHSFVGMAVQGCFFFAIDAALGILKDRKNGIWRRLQASPLSKGMLLAGKFGSITLISLIILSAVFLAGRLLFGIEVMGSMGGFLLVFLATALMIAGFGLLVASLGKTEAQCRGFATPLVLGMAILGGAWFPSFMMPAWVQQISKFIPSRWAVDGFDAMTWRGGSFTEALLPAGILVAFSLAFTTIAYNRFKWESE